MSWKTYRSDIIEDLSSKRKSLRHHAAHEVGKFKVAHCGDALYKAYLKERDTTDDWLLKVKMIRSLGLINYKPALEEIESLVKGNKPHDMITYAAAQAYVRIKRESLSDASPVIESLRSGEYSVIKGCLYVLGKDRMEPSDEEIQELLKLGWDAHTLAPGKADPRYGLATACAGWDKKLTSKFLEHCIETGDKKVIEAAESALEGEYINLPWP